MSARAGSRTQRAAEQALERHDIKVTIDGRRQDGRLVRRYAYSLSWTNSEAAETPRSIAFLLMNPTERTDIVGFDHTVNLCVRLARRANFTEAHILNLCPVVRDTPVGLMKFMEGDESRRNSEAIERILGSPSPPLAVVCAWGRQGPVATLLKPIADLIARSRTYVFEKGERGKWPPHPRGACPGFSLESKTGDGGRCELRLMRASIRENGVIDAVHGDPLPLSELLDHALEQVRQTEPQPPTQEA